MGKHLLTIHGHKVYCDDDRAWHGVEYLAYKMSEDEVKELFSQVESQREVNFDDDHERHFTIIDGEEGSFTVVTHDKPSGWF